jgi:hypothetical protein
VGVAAALLVAAAGFVTYRAVTRGDAARGLAANAPAAAVPAPPPAVSEVRILAGRGPGGYTDPDGQVWEGDRYFRGGEAISCRTDIVTRGFDRNLFAGMREGTFEYAIPLKPGTYEVELFFAETQYGEGNPLGGEDTARRFGINANGAPLISTFNLLEDAGMPDAADSRVFKDLRPAADGLLHLQFVPNLGYKAMVNAIRVRPNPPGRMNPIRIAAQRQPYRDPSGHWWMPDRYYTGGTQVVRPTLPMDPNFPHLFQGERYGDFTYSIPVAPGTYSATMYFCEYWWGQGHPGGTGRRRFDVYCNFKPLLKGFDISSEAGAAQTVTRVFHGLTPNRHGKLVFSFVADLNFALVNAIEIVDESGP